MSFGDNDDKIMQELQSQDIKGFTDRGKLAIRELAGGDEVDVGALLFIILSLNSRIRDLENKNHQKEVKH